MMNVVEYGLPDDLDMSCGMYRKELIARLAGVEVSIHNLIYIGMLITV